MKNMLAKGFAVALMTLATLATTDSAQAQGQPIQGIRVGDLTLSPFADLSATWDSNVRREYDREVDDTFFDAVGGLEAAYSAGQFMLQAEGFLMNRSYSKESDMDFNGGGERVSLSYDNAKALSLRAYESYVVTEDSGRYITTPGETSTLYLDAPVNRMLRSRNEATTIGAEIARDFTEKVGAAAEYSYTQVAYDTEDLQDIKNQMGTLSGIYRMTEKSYANLRGSYGISEDDVLSDPAESYIISAGFGTHAVEKFTFAADAGWMNYQRPTGPDGEDTDDDNTVYYNFNADWKPTDQITVQAGVRNGYSQSAQYAGNAALNTQIWLGMAYRATETVDLSWINTYRQDDYLDPVVDENGVETDDSDTGYGSHLRVTYTAPTRWLSVYGSAGYEKVESAGGDYDQVRLSLGAHLQY